MSKTVQLPVLIGNMSTKTDGSVKGWWETRELSGTDVAQLFDLRNTEAYMILAPNEIKEEDVKLPSERADPAVGTKTPSQRLRNVLYRVWQQSSGGTDFESYYRIKIEQLIDKFKEKLDD